MMRPEKEVEMFWLVGAVGAVCVVAAGAEYLLGIHAVSRGVLIPVRAQSGPGRTDATEDER